MRQQPARSASAPRLQSAGLSAHHHQELSLLTKGLQCSSRQLLGQVNGESNYFYNLLFQDKKLPRAFLIFGVNSYSASHLYPSLFLSLCFLSFLFFFSQPQCVISIKDMYFYILSRLKILGSFRENALSNLNLVSQGQFCYYEFRNIRTYPLS